jgi:ABC-type transport system involved in multi-copper enzyme maturation permease subunit
MSGLLRYEWVRVSTVRSTWILAIVAIALPAILVLLLSWTSAALDGTVADGGLAVNGTVLLVTAAIFATVGAASFGQEYRHGLIRLTLSQFPRRVPVFTVKLLVVVVAAAVIAILGLAAAVVGEYLGASFGGGAIRVSLPDLLMPAAQGIAFVVLFVLMAFAITALTRNQPLGIIVPIVMAAVIEPILIGVSSVAEWTWMEWVLPFTASAASIGADGAQPWAHLGVQGLWVLAVLIPAWFLFLRRDA